WVCGEASTTTTSANYWPARRGRTISDPRGCQRAALRRGQFVRAAPNRARLVGRAAQRGHSGLSLLARIEGVYSHRHQPALAPTPAHAQRSVRTCSNLVRAAVRATHPANRTSLVTLAKDAQGRPCCGQPGVRCAPGRAGGGA